ncbi:MAG: hypothetical protein AAGM29_05745, partial [Cyanobacteria bacterium J06588_4]
SWMRKIQTHLMATEYEYLTFVAYSCEQVSLRLRGLIADSNISETVMDNCAWFYEKVKHQRIQQAQAIVEQTPELAIACQTRILDRVSLVVQNDAVAELQDKGIISPSVASQVHRLVAFK